MSRPRRVIGYARVSSEEQAKGSSLRDQQASIAGYAKSLGVEVARFFVEAESAVHEKIERREQIQTLLSDVRRGDLVVVDKLDRWSRDPEFTYRSVREILAAGAGFFAVAERLDPSTSEGDTALGFRVLFAREEHKRIRERTVGTRKRLRDAGYYVEGSPPFGYRRAKPKGHRGAEKNILVVVPEEAELVRQAFWLSARGVSLAQIAERLGLLKDRIADIVHRRVYLGEVQNAAGEWIRGKHEALINASLFARVQAGLDLRKNGGPRTRTDSAETDTWILRDVATCALCGSRMSAAYAGPHEARRYYYRCTGRCTPRYVPVRDVEEQAAPMVLARLVELREELARDPEPPRARPADAERRAKLQAKRARFLELYADGVMGREELRSAVARVDADLARVEPEAAPDPAVRRALLRQVAELQRAWERSGPRRRRKIVAELVVAFLVAPGQPPEPRWRGV